MKRADIMNRIGELTIKARTAGAARMTETEKSALLERAARVEAAMRARGEWPGDVIEDTGFAAQLTDDELLWALHQIVEEREAAPGWSMAGDRVRARDA